MAAQDVANVRGDAWDVFINDSLAPFYASVSAGPQIIAHPFKTQRMGDTILGHLVEGHKCSLSFVFQEMTVQDAIRWNGLTGATGNENPLPAVGTLLPNYSIRLHNKGDGDDTTKDIYFPAANFLGFSMSTDGRGTADQTVAAEAVRDPATGVLSQIGWVDPS